MATSRLTRLAVGVGACIGAGCWLGDGNFPATMVLTAGLLLVMVTGWRMIHRICDTAP